MKLKDFKNKPDQYNEIVDICKRKSITVNDESDVSEIIGLINSFNAVTDVIAGRQQRTNHGAQGNTAVDLISAGILRARK